MEKESLPIVAEATPQETQAQDTGVQVQFMTGTEDGKVCIVYQEPVVTMKLTPGKARRLAQSLIKCARQAKEELS